MELYTVKNTDGMTCFSSYMLFTYDNELIGMDLVGAETSVKAVWASIMSRKQITLGYRRLSAPIFPVTTVREKLCGNSLPLLRWHIVPLQQEGQIVIYGWNALMTLDQALYGALSRYSVWPVLPEWFPVLTELGQEHNLLRPIRYMGCDYAYIVDLTDWSAVFNEAISKHLIVID